MAKQGPRDVANAFFRALSSKTPIGPIYYVFGEESYLLDRAVEAICKAAAPEGLNDFNHEVLRGKDTSGSKLRSAAEMLPFMCPRRVVVLRDMQEMNTSELDALSDYFEDPNPSTCLIIHAMTAQKKPNGRLGIMKKLKKAAVTCEFASFREHEAGQFLTKQAARRNLKLERGVDAHILASVGARLADIEQALEKIDLYVGGEGQRHVTLADVGQVIAQTKTETVFALTDALGDRKLEEAIRILDRMMLMGESAIGINTMIARHFRILAKLHDPSLRSASRSDQARGAGVHPFFLKDYARHARAFAPRDVERVLEHLVETDRLLKSSKLSDRTLMEGLLLEVLMGGRPVAAHARA